jgi:lipid II:glycine glycyltransferase (peptidoglycan interpeptide bridge formation enzyme)
MLVLDRKLLLFRVKEIHFADKPFDIYGCDRLNFLYCKGKFDMKGFICTPYLTLVTNLTEDVDVLWKKLTSHCRQKINRAQKDDTKISINEHYEEFYDIFRLFASQKRSYGLPFGIGLPNLDTLKRCSTLFTAELQGETIAGHLFLQGETIFRAYISVSKRLGAQAQRANSIGNANRLAYWEALKYAKGKGLLEFDWGGVWPDEEANADPIKGNINRVKREFGGERVQLYCYEKVYSRKYRIAHNVLERVPGINLQ